MHFGDRATSIHLRLLAERVEEILKERGMLCALVRQSEARKASRPRVPLPARTAQLIEALRIFPEY